MTATHVVATAAELLESAEYFAMPALDAQPRMRVQVAALEAERQQLERDAKRFDSMAAEEAGRRETLDGRRARAVDESERAAAICRQVAARIGGRIAALTSSDDRARRDGFTLETQHEQRAWWALHEMAAARAAGI
jgi:hypothetical protein